jgi:hypothetical protein
VAVSSEAEAVKEMVDIVDVISHYIRLQKSGQSYKALCPFHDEKTPSFSVSPQKQIYKCFGCNEAGDVFTFVMKYEDVSFPVAVQRVIEICQLDLETKPVRSKRIEEPVREKLPDVELDRISRALQKALPLYSHHRKHLMEERGMTEEEIIIRGYRSFPDKPWAPFKNFEIANLKGFPGVYQKEGKNGPYWLLNNMGEGILIPFHNEYNQIVGWQIRLDNPKPSLVVETDFPYYFMAVEVDGVIKVLWEGTIINDLILEVGASKTFYTQLKGQKIKIGKVSLHSGQKYLWLSSTGKWNGTGAGNPIPIHVAVPVAKRQKWPTGHLLQVKKVWITEGPIKAEIAAQKLNQVFLSVPGITSWRPIFDLITKMGVEEIVLAFDMDIARKKELREQIKTLKMELEKQSQIQKCWIALWREDKHGKGIDDMLLNGFKPQVRPLFG